MEECGRRGEFIFRARDSVKTGWVSLWGLRDVCYVVG